MWVVMLVQRANRMAQTECYGPYETYTLAERAARMDFDLSYWMATIHEIKVPQSSGG